MDKIILKNNNNHDYINLIAFGMLLLLLPVVPIINMTTFGIDFLNFFGLIIMFTISVCGFIYFAKADQYVEINTTEISLLRKNGFNKFRTVWSHKFCDFKFMIIQKTDFDTYKVPDGIKVLLYKTDLQTKTVVASVLYTDLDEIKLLDFITKHHLPVKLTNEMVTRK